VPVGDAPHRQVPLAQVPFQVRVAGVEQNELKCDQLRLGGFDEPFELLRAVDLVDDYRYAQRSVTALAGESESFSFFCV
jgi:hypothetical protein